MEDREKDTPNIFDEVDSKGDANDIAFSRIAPLTANSFKFLDGWSHLMRLTGLSRRRERK